MKSWTFPSQHVTNLFNDKRIMYFSSIAIKLLLCFNMQNSSPNFLHVPIQWFNYKIHQLSSQTVGLEVALVVSNELTLVIHYCCTGLVHTLPWLLFFFLSSSFSSMSSIYALYFLLGVILYIYPTKWFKGKTNYHLKYQQTS